MWFLSKFVDQQNKKAWEAQASINDSLFGAIDVCKKHTNERTDLYFGEIRELNMRIASLEQKFELYESIPSDTKMVNAAIKYAEASKKGKSKDKEILGKRIENISNELDKIKNEKNPFKYSNKDAIIDILNKHRGQKLVCQAVYAKLKTYNTKKPYVPLTSVRATLYWVARKKISGIKLCDETETARFFIEKE